MDHDLRSALGDSFRLQAKICAKSGAPLCGVILEGCGAEIRTRGGTLDPILNTWTDTNFDAALPLRVLGALHRLALDGKAPALAALLPSCGGNPDQARAWPEACAVLASAPDFVRSYLDRPPQTNEVGRSAMLLGGFLEIAAARGGLPLRLLEVGASAGLNLCWDRYRVETPAFTWGPVDAALTLRCAWEGSVPTLPRDARVISRRGCDKNPVDLGNAADRQRLESYVWADQIHRLTRLRAAADIVLAERIVVDQENAETWLPRQLAALPEGVATVVYHSIMWQYLPAETQNNLRAAIEEAAERTTADAPLAWLRMELSDMKTLPQLTLTMWPGGQTHDLATVHFHGDFVRWRG